MTISGQSSLAKEDIERMVKDAEAHAEEDRQRREEAEVRNTADSLVYQTEKVLKDEGATLEGPERDQLEASLSELKETLPGTDLERIRAASDRVTTASQAFAARLYQQAGADQTGSGSDDDVVDAEIVD